MDDDCSFTNNKTGTIPIVTRSADIFKMDGMERKVEITPAYIDPMAEPPLIVIEARPIAIPLSSDDMFSETEAKKVVALAPHPNP